MKQDSNKPVTTSCSICPEKSRPFPSRESNSLWITYYVKESRLIQSISYTLSSSVSVAVCEPYNCLSVPSFIGFVPTSGLAASANQKYHRVIYRFTKMFEIFYFGLEKTK